MGDGVSDYEHAADVVGSLKPLARSKSEKQAVKRVRSMLYRQVRESRTVRQETESRGRP